MVPDSTTGGASPTSGQKKELRFVVLVGEGGLYTLMEGTGVVRRGVALAIISGVKAVRPEKEVILGELL